MKVATAAGILNVSRTAVRNYIQGGVIRARKPSGKPLEVFREDLRYVYSHRKCTTRGKGKLQTLVQRGVLPEEYTGLSGPEALKHAKEVGHAFAECVERSLKYFPIPPLPLPTEPARFLESLGAHTIQDTYVDPFPTKLPPKVEDTKLDRIEKRINEVESVLKGFAASLLAEKSYRDFSDKDCELLLTKVSEVLGRPLKTADLDYWSGSLRRLNSYHISRLCQWARSFPEIAQHVADPQLPAFAPLLTLAFRVRSRAEGAPGAQLSGSAASRSRLLAIKCYEHIEELCLEFTTVDSILRAETDNSVRVGSSVTDRWILHQIVRED